MVSDDEKAGPFQPDELDDTMLGKLESHLKACKDVLESHLEACESATAQLAPRDSD